MTVLDELKKLDEQRAKLIDKAKAEALKQAEQAVEDLNALGFNYSLSDKTRPTPTVRGQRRTGIRQEVLQAIADNPDGINRAELLDKLDAKGNKSAEQSISNALSALKKSDSISADGGVYRAA